MRIQDLGSYRSGMIANSGWGLFNANSPPFQVHESNTEEATVAAYGFIGAELGFDRNFKKMIKFHYKKPR